MSSDKHRHVSAPFFIVGCPRSGTTMLRDMLRLHPNLASPEETHFFRWAEPFGSVGYVKGLQNNVVLKRHRAIDRISEPEFSEIMAQSVSRFDLYRRYMKLYIQRNKPGAKRWFDKTPQNVYGALLIAAQSNSRIVHIVRDPIQVVSSLRIGKVMKMDSLVGACNYWNEAADVMHGLRRAYPQRVHEVRYEDFTKDPAMALQRILEFVGEASDPALFAEVHTQAVIHDDEEVLTLAERRTVESLCQRWSRHYGYVHEIGTTATQGRDVTADLT